MKNNSYLGDCLCVTYSPTDKEVDTDHLLSKHILVIVKSKINLDSFKTIEDIKKNKIFINNKPVLLRISSECLLGYLGDTHCDCESQRISSLREIHRHGEGIFIYLPQEGQGNGLFYKTKELELQVNGFSPSGKFIGQKSIIDAASILLGSSRLLDKRRYTSLMSVINGLGFKKYIFSLLSDNPDKKKYLENYLGVKISSIHKAGTLITVDNIGEYLSKLYSKNFILSNEELNEIHNLINLNKEIPERAISVLRFIREDIKLGKKFNTNNELLNRLINLLDTKIKKQSIQDLGLFKDSEAYKEYHIELKIDSINLSKLFKAGILLNDESLHYEENYFYNLPYFPSIPCRTLKIRKIFKLNELRHSISSELIYKIPIRDRFNLIKCVKIYQEDIINLIDMALKENSVHFVPVLTHAIKGKHKDLKILVKRYSKDLRVLSLMGNKNIVRSLISEIKKISNIKEVNSLSDLSCPDDKFCKEFDYEKLVVEEIALFKKYFKG